MRYIKTDWYQWHDTHASLLVQVDWHRLLVPENWSVCMALRFGKSFGEDLQAAVKEAKLDYCWS